MLEDKQLAIAFAKYICKSELSKETDIIGLDNKPQVVKYWPIEFQVMLDQLELQGDDIFDEFINKQKDNDTSTVSSGELSSNVQDVLG